MKEVIKEKSNRKLREISTEDLKQRLKTAAMITCGAFIIGIVAFLVFSSDFYQDEAITELTGFIFIFSGVLFVIGIITISVLLIQNWAIKNFNRSIEKEKYRKGGKNE